MDISNNSVFTKYLELRKNIDSHSNELEGNYSQHMKCKKGCDLCCMDYSIFPIEFYFILNDLKEKKLNVKPHIKENIEECIFLVNHSCTIYAQRPIICRTHGLPLLFMNDNNDWELSACELNFTAFNFEEFTIENTYPQDKYNSKLFLLNKEFIASFKEKKYREFDLIPIRELAKYME